MRANVTMTPSIEEIRQKIIRGQAIGMIAWASLVGQDAQLKAPVKTGRLARSIPKNFDISDVKFETDHRATIVIGTNVEYAAAQEFGSGIHAENPADRQLILIEAKHKKALAFVWKNGPTDIPAYNADKGMWFFRRVWHPGVPAHPYLRPAAEQNMETGKRLVMESILSQLRLS